MKEEQSPEKSAKAKRLRLDIAKVRIEAEKVKKAQKEEYLRAGNAIQGVYNILKFAVVEKEEKLKEVEEFYQRLEEEKRKRLHAEREAALAKFDFDGSTTDLGSMEEAVWTNFLAGTRATWEAVKEAERKAEEERIQAEKKRAIFQDRRSALLPLYDFIDLSKLTEETTEEEFTAMKAEAQEAKKAYEVEQEKIRAENERLRKEREEAEAKAAEEKRKADEALRKEREAREAAEQKERERQAEEARKAAAEAEAKKKAAAAPDREKLIQILEYVSGTDHGFSTETAKEAMAKCYGIIKDAINRLS
jgi:hypothetical protein